MAPLKTVHTEAAPPPFSAYSQAVAVPAGSRLLHVSGQVGVSPDGELAQSEQAQHEQVWRNLLAILAADGMGPGDIVSIDAYITTQSGVAIYRQVRDRVLDGATPASTLLIVSGLADPAWLVEIAVVAAKAEQ